MGQSDSLFLRGAYRVDYHRVGCGKQIVPCYNGRSIWAGPDLLDSASCVLRLHVWLGPDVKEHVEPNTVHNSGGWGVKGW